MTLFLINILLAFIWAALTAHFSAENIALGFIISFLILAATSQIWGDKSYAKKTWFLVKFFGFIIWEILVSSCKVAACVLQPNLKNKSAVIAIPLDVKTDLAITLMANLISLTPGTLALDVSTDKKFLFVHTMFATDIEKLRFSFKKDIEQKLLRMME